MNGNVNFMSGLRRLILAVKSERKLINALELKEFLIAHHQFLSESKSTIEFIDALFILCEEFDTGLIESFYTVACQFYIAILDMSAIDIFFVGKSVNYQDCIGKIKHQKYHVEYFNSDDAIDYSLLSKKISDSSFSILINDYDGSNALLNKGVCRPFAHLYHEKQLPKTNRKLYEDWGVFLAYQYKRFQQEKYDQVILGSSYSYRALTHVNSVNSVSFSVPGLDITNAVTLYQIIQQIPFTRTTIFCFGLYDFFKEIKRGNAAVYVNALKGVMAFRETVLHDNASEQRHPAASGSLFDINMPIDEIVQARYFVMDDGSAPEPPLAKEAVRNIVNVLQARNNATLSRRASPDEINRGGAHTVSLHNKYVKYDHSYELNCRLLTEVKAQAERTGNKVYFIIPPLPESYVDNLDEMIKQRAYRFLGSIDSEHFQVCDFSRDNDFSYADFFDGHHMNDHGAEKFRRKLWSAGILSQPEL